MSQAHVSALFVYACDLFSPSDIPQAVPDALNFIQDILSNRSDHPAAFSAINLLIRARQTLSGPGIFDDFEARQTAADYIREAAHRWERHLSTTFSTYTVQIRVPHFSPVQVDGSAPGAPSAGADGDPPVGLGNLVVNSETGL